MCEIFFVTAAWNKGMERNL